MSLKLIYIALFVGAATSMLNVANASHSPVDYLSFYLPETNLKELVLILKGIEENHNDGWVYETLKYLKLVKSELEKPSPALSTIGFNDLEMNSTDRLRIIWVTDNLLQLADRNQKPLSDDIKHIITVINLAFGNVESFSRLLQESQTSDVKNVKLFKYLKHFGLNYLRGCFNHYMERDNRKTIFNSLDTTSEIKFDRIYKSLEEESNSNILQDENDDISLTRSTKEFDLLHSKFNARKMLNIIKKEFDNSDDPSGGAKEIFYHFFEANCARLRSSMGTAFDVYNLSRALIPELAKQTFSVRFQKLNEYSRICLPIQNPQVRDKAIESIKTNLDNVWYKKALKKLSTHSV